MFLSLNFIIPFNMNAIGFSGNIIIPLALLIAMHVLLHSYKLFDRCVYLLKFILNNDILWT